MRRGTATRSELGVLAARIKRITAEPDGEHLERQILITGRVEKVSVAEAAAYFVTRPVGSQLAAWASPQSTVLSSRGLLEAKWEEMKHKFADGRIPLPSFWGGYRVLPDLFEFWQGRSSRMHDRFQYTRTDGAWVIERLAP